MKKIATIFPDATSVHLSKDVGLIPTYFSEHLGYDNLFISYKNGQDHIQSKLLNIVYMSKRKIKFFVDWTVVSYLCKQAKNIDILHLFHFSLPSIIYGLIYKLFNRHGKLYLKLDLNEKQFFEYKRLLILHSFIGRKLAPMLEFCMINACDCISSETIKSIENLKHDFPRITKRIIHIPNGVDDKFIENNIKIKPFNQRENIILHISRIGSYQKNTELLVQSFALSSLTDWKLYLIGPIEAHFLEWIKDTYSNNPELIQRIVIIGNITNRSELFEYFNIAKFLALSSRYEGFPVVFAEALYFGLKIITTNVSGAEEATRKNSFGFIVMSEDPKIYAQALNSECISKGHNESDFKKIIAYSHTNLKWSNQVEKIHALLWKS